MKKEISSEEKLLNLIRKKNPADKKDQAKTPPLNPAAWMPPAGDPWGFLKTMTLMFMTICLGLTVYIVSQIVLVKPAADDLAGLEQARPEIEDETSGPEEILPQPKLFTDYAQTFSQRDLFMSALQRAQAGTVTAPAPDAPPAPPVLDLAQNFKLVGIILDNDPKAVVEDVRNQRTLFLSHGDQLEGAVLKEIRDGKVIFMLNDQRLELVP